MTSRSRLHAAVLAAVMGLLSSASPAHALRVVTWNLFAYPDYNLAARQPSFRTVMANINADVLIAQELLSSAGVDSFQKNVLDVVDPGGWGNSGFWTLQSSPSVEGGAIFWRRAVVDTVSFVNTLVTGGPRNVLFGRVVPKAVVNVNGTFRAYSVHFKAGGPATADSTTRRLEATSLRTSLNAVPANTNFLVGGDTNIYGAYEGAYLRLVESQTDNDGRGVDPLALAGNWHTNASYAVHHTQCPCATGCGSFSGGGMDDRFDLWMSSTSMTNGQGVDVVSGGYAAYGNDGQHYNTDINGGGFNNVVGLTIATALKNASDHLPVIVTVQVAARASVPAAVGFGSVITGATAQQNLTVTNGALAPADALTYTLTAPSGFTAPGGSFNAAVGAPNNHTLTMSTASAGNKAGNLSIATDDPDAATRLVALSGTVLAHAVASLDSSAAVAEDSVRFGIHPAGGFTDQAVRVHNRGWSVLQARLAVGSAAITGGAGRFTVAGGFAPDTLAGTGRTWNLHFDDAGATADSLYEATLTFTTADEALPGATAQSPLTLRMVAQVEGGTTAVVPGATPAALAFLPPRPNPVSGEAGFAFDLPRPMRASLEVFDLGGRLVARVADGELAAGRHELRWAPRDESGRRVAAGLYFARFSAGSFTRSHRLIVLP